MQWEFLGKQEMRDSDRPGKGYAYTPLIWRTPVPGGWLLMTVNSKSNDPQPTISFYPDYGHAWNPFPDPQAKTLLRAAGGTGQLPPGDLLRAFDGLEPPQIEE